MESSLFVLFASKNSLPPTLHFSSWGKVDKFCDNRFKERKKIIALYNNHNMSAPTALRQEQPLEAQPQAVSYG
jgi:hypothetical protein